MVNYREMVEDAYGDIGRSGIGGGVNQIDLEGLDYWTNRAQQENLTPDQFQDIFGSAVGQYFEEKPTDRYTDYVTDYLVRDQYGDIGRTDIGNKANQIDQEGYDYWTNQLISGALSPNDLDSTFDWAVQNAISEKPLNVKSAQRQTPAATKDYVINYLRDPSSVQERTFTPGTPATLQNMGVSGKSANTMMGPGNATYESDLIKALRGTNTESANMNPGFTTYQTTAGTAGKYSGGTAGGSAFNPDVFSSTPATPGQVTDWNAYNAYKVSQLGANQPILSFDQWKNQPPAPEPPAFLYYPSNDAGGGA